ncbi:hypothetical protein pb186bvf_005790 [Paramecium bursaria]
MSILSILSFSIAFYGLSLVITQIIGWLTIHNAILYTYNNCNCDMEISYRCNIPDLEYQITQTPDTCDGLSNQQLINLQKASIILQINIYGVAFYKCILIVLLAKRQCTLMIQNKLKADIEKKYFNTMLYILIVGYMGGSGSLIYSSVLISQIKEIQQIQFNNQILIIFIVLSIMQFFKSVSLGYIMIYKYLRQTTINLSIQEQNIPPTGQDPESPQFQQQLSNFMVFETKANGSEQIPKLYEVVLSPK